MGMTEFLARYRATDADVNAYVATLPVWVNVWRGWMFLVFGAALVFLIWKREARWLAATMVVSLFAYNVVAMISGVGRFPSLALVVFWLPLLIYLNQRRSGLPASTRFDRMYSRWLAAAVVTLALSVGFDTYNVAYSLIRDVP
ncbi:MAG: hypothetical protein ACREQQ_15775 [Candidatus Binatia bacterium]